MRQLPRFRLVSGCLKQLRIDANSNIQSVDSQFIKGIWLRASGQRIAIESPRLQLHVPVIAVGGQRRIVYDLPNSCTRTNGCKIKLPGNAYALAQTTNGFLWFGTMPKTCRLLSTYDFCAMGLPFSRICMLELCRIRKRPDHRPIRAYSVGFKRRRADCRYGIGTIFGWVSLGRRP